MASIGTALPAATNNTTTTSGTSGSNSTSSSNSMNGLGNTSTFLSLLVAQLQNQDPTSPVDGTAFVTQLAEFNDVEQNLAVRTDMDAVSEKYLGTSTPPSAANGDSTTNTTNTQGI
jgi:flagellar basal-body rod modification protein FlgD